MKRACPFDTGLYRQTKIHLTDYEIDRDTINIVQAKTMRKLFCKSVEPQAVKKTVEIENYPRDRNMKQMPVSNYFLNNNINQLKKTEKCCENAMDILQNCSYCDKTSVLFKCVKCLEGFCQQCTFNVYGTAEDETICISCS